MTAFQETGSSADNGTPTLDILIPTLVHRTEMLTGLLEHLGKQMVPGVGVVCYRDNREALYGWKCQQLYHASQADYVCQIDDDDWVVDDYLPTVMEALEQRPDYVGYKVYYTEAGVPALPVDHSLRHGGWINQSDILLRDICHKNPIRRDLAIQADWVGDGGADMLWAFDLRKLGIVKTEVYIDREMYEYRADGPYNSSSLPPMDDPPPAPDFPFVTWI